jgi:hypothetical protein
MRAPRPSTVEASNEDCGQGFIVDSWGALEMEGYLFFGPFKPNMSSFKITAFVFYVLLGVMGTHTHSHHLHPLPSLIASTHS